MINSQELANTIKEVAKSKKIAIGKMLSDCGLSVNTLSSMQSGGYYPRLEAIAKIADYLSVSVDYLLGNETDFKSQTESVISDDDIKFALWGDVADEIPNDKLQEVKTFAEFIKNTYKKDNNK